MEAEHSVQDVLEGAASWHLHCGDSLPWLSSLPDGCVDAVVTDPPYSSGGRGVAKKASTKKKYGLITGHDFEGDHKDQRSWTQWTTTWLSECYRAARPEAPICLFSDWRMLPCASDALQGAGWIWRGVLPWIKPACRPQKGRFAAQAEFVLWGSKGRMPFDRIAGKVLPGHYAVSPPGASRKIHSTEKPSELLAGLLEICEPESVILDPFAGAGTTGAAALPGGHRVLLAEMVPHYQEAIRRKLGSL